LIAKELRKKLDMASKIRHRSAEISTSSVADIAFLLLSFFLMTTIIENDKGLYLILPEWREVSAQAPIHERNLFKVHLNSYDEVMIEGEISTLTGLKERIREFVLNNGSKPHLSDDPKSAIVSLRSDRGTSHGIFVHALDEIQGAYDEIYAERAGMSVNALLNLSQADREKRPILEKIRREIPMNISLAQPSGSGK
jgi:biopolymer transport protein ExbD